MKSLQRIPKLGYNTRKNILYLQPEATVCKGERAGLMIRSMTGFGRGRAENDNREIAIELKTVNHRYLDISLRMPRALSILEDDARRHIQHRLSRGRVEVHVSYKSKAKNGIEVTLNEPAADAYYSAFLNLTERFGLEGKPDLAVMSGMDDIFIISEPEEDENELRRLFFSALDDALQVALDMRCKEGSFLAEDIGARCRVIGDMLSNVEQRSPLVVDEYRYKLEQRLKELLNNTELDEVRFQTEVAYFAERSNITEEIIRLKSHLAQLQKTLSTGGSVGRKLDFIVQEMNREVNTIGSKSSDIEITNHVVNIKSEIEKIREQIQNIE